jgi:outer membrane protein assembly factor BamB
MKDILTRALLLSQICFFGWLSASTAISDDWSQYRGPHTNGVADATSAPTKWGPNENLLWRSPLPQPGNGSAIVVQEKIFVTSALDPEGKQRSLLCLDAANGKELWRQTVTIDEIMPTHKTNPYCGTTPASDGKRVYVWHASAGLYCYDLEGKQVWQRDFGKFVHMWGYGTSPIIVDDKLILHSGPGKKIFVSALNLQNGETIWEHSEPISGDGQTNTDGKFFGSWSTPIVHQVDGQTQLIVALPTRVVAFDADNGAEIWTCRGISHGGGDLAYSAPIIVGKICFVTGGYSGPTMAIGLGGSGDVTETHRLYRLEKSPQSIGTGVAVDGYIYRPNAGANSIECIDPETGNKLWVTRASGGAHWGSIVQVSGLLYATDQDGKTSVFQPDPEMFAEIATNQLGQPTNSTPAVAENRLYFRTQREMICVGSE